jgi:hypothetical protein
MTAFGSINDWRNEAEVRRSPIQPRFGPSVPSLLSSAWQLAHAPFDSKIAFPAATSALDGDGPR